MNYAPSSVAVPSSESRHSDCSGASLVHCDCSVCIAHNCAVCSCSWVAPVAYLVFVASVAASFHSIL